MFLWLISDIFCSLYGARNVQTYRKCIFVNRIRSGVKCIRKLCFNRNYTGVCATRGWWIVRDSLAPSDLISCEWRHSEIRILLMNLWWPHGVNGYQFGGISMSNEFMHLLMRNELIIKLWLFYHHRKSFFFQFGFHPFESSSLFEGLFIGSWLDAEMPNRMIELNTFRRTAMNIKFKSKEYEGTSLAAVTTVCRKI